MEVLPPFLSSPLRTVEATDGDAAGDEPFTVIFVADSEPRMRGNTVAEVEAYVSNLIAYKSSRVEYFDYGGGSTHRIDPAMVILGGDISEDHSTSLSADMPIWQRLEDHGVAFLAGFGNHDWENYDWYSFNGDGWNRETTNFCRESYWNASIVAAPHFGYREFGPSDERGPVTFLANFRGVQIVNFNSFLYQPSYHYDFTSPAGQECMTSNTGVGWSGCQVFTSAEPQIAELEAALSEDSSTPTLFVQHYPLSRSDSSWDDAGASNTTLEQKKRRLGALLDRYSHRALLSGHQHQFAVHEHDDTEPGKTGYFEYVAPYFGGDGGVDPDQGGGFLAVLVSKSLGILEVKHVATPLAGSGLELEPATTVTTTAEAVDGEVVICKDLSILPSDTSEDTLTQCVLGNCVLQAVACGQASECTDIFGPLLTQGGLSLEDVAAIAWAAKAAGDTNVVVQEVNQCLDANCGTSVATAVCGGEGAAPETTTTTTEAEDVPPSTAATTTVTERASESEEDVPPSTTATTTMTERASESEEDVPPSTTATTTVAERTAESKEDAMSSTRKDARPWAGTFLCALLLAGAALVIS